MAEVHIEGTCDPGFERVREAFAGNFAQRGDVGAAVAVTIDGRPVIDLWGGYADKQRTRPWQRDTIVNVYSATKGVAATCLNRLADNGRVDLDAPVARYWPEFAQAGKERIPVRWLLSHRAGLPAVSKPLASDALLRWDVMAAALAEQEPWWEPGTRHGYHALTFGYLVGEVVRRVDGRSLGTYCREEIARPLQIDFHIGLDARDDARCAEMIAPMPPVPGAPHAIPTAAPDPNSMAAKAMNNPAGAMRFSTVNSRAWRGAEVPAANGHTNARALARFYGALARGGELDGVRVLSPAQIERCLNMESDGIDAVVGVPMRFGLGYRLTQPAARYGPNPRTFGHTGAGGSLGFADPDAKVGFAYTMNQMGSHILIDPRVVALLDALYACM
ncbi:MAG TPA: serine hydrolase domain-containing protein [Candidatus Binataceae bacterium]|jgi:CubicO group peptidase (beta-lactamase class C family)|nr:serine hydrolase domain-containing protein [Candidatus Binataceae bacterium]